MKTNKIFNYAAGIALMVGATGCSSDYLDLEPEGTLQYTEVLDNAQGATLAVTGLCQSMYRQYSALYDYYWFNGEPWLSMYYGEVMGQDYISLFWFNSYPNLVNWTQMNTQSRGARVAWAYCYGLIGPANNILSFAPKQGVNGEIIHYGEPGEVLKDANGNPVPDFSESESPDEYMFRYAQALTFRAHAYLRLMQIYAPRWQDRINPSTGDEYGTVPLRLEYVEPEGNLDCPLSPMSVVMDQIYADLYQAIDLYQNARYGRAYNWEPDLQIAQGIFSRAALLKEDWQLAYDMAKAAWAGYDLMSSDDYIAGFAEPTSEWMWTNSGEAQGLYYASFGATYACNGAYPCGWGSIGAGACDYFLLKEASSYDLRSRIFYNPLTSAKQPSEFWGSGCDSRTLDINRPSSSLHSDFVTFAEAQYARVGEAKGWDPPYTYLGYMMHPNNTICTAQFGAQFKFWGVDNYSSSHFPFMRASEMLLNQAEAAWHLGNEQETRELLDQLNIKRYRVRANGNSYYSNLKTSGEELLKNLKTFRRLELWGEGFNWFDLKRWRQPMIRVAWKSGDVNSGNWPQSVTNGNGEFPIDMYRGWRWRIPSVEYNYNHAIDQAEATAGEGTDDDDVTE